MARSSTIGAGGSLFGRPANAAATHVASRTFPKSSRSSHRRPCSASTGSSRLQWACDRRHPESRQHSPSGDSRLGWEKPKRACQEIPNSGGDSLIQPRARRSVGHAHLHCWCRIEGEEGQVETTAGKIAGTSSIRELKNVLQRTEGIASAFRSTSLRRAWTFHSRQADLRANCMPAIRVAVCLSSRPETCWATVDIPIAGRRSANTSPSARRACGHAKVSEPTGAINRPIKPGRHHERAWLLLQQFIDASVALRMSARSNHLTHTTMLSSYF